MKTIHLPGLNGLRAIAAIGVVLSHITLALPNFGLPTVELDQQGRAGVVVFFAISGFLITYLLLKEKEVTGTLDIRAFYIRRILRIWPLYYLFLVLVLLTVFLFALPFKTSSIALYVFLAANVPYSIGGTIPLLAHYWSLGVEEQFYLFFPQLARFSNKTLLRTVFLLIALFVTVKVGCYVLKIKYGIDLPFRVMTVNSFHVMLIGVAGAILFYYSNRTFMRLATHPLTQALSWGCLLLIAIGKFHLSPVADVEILGLASLALIIGQATKKGLLNLENNAFDFIGKISYGVYVIHPLLIFYGYQCGKLPVRWWSYIVVFGGILTATLLLAYGSYEWYEKRFLKKKTLYQRIKSSNSK